MKNFIQQELNSTFSYEGKTLKVLNATYGCEGCYFFKTTHKGPDCEGFACLDLSRKDGNSVMFVEQEEGDDRKKTIGEFLKEQGYVRDCLMTRDIADLIYKCVGENFTQEKSPFPVKISCKDLSYEDRVNLLKELLDTFENCEVTAKYGATDVIFSDAIKATGSNSIEIQTEICTG